jgi:hypothetical protein
MHRSEPQFCRDEVQRILELAKECSDPCGAICPDLAKGNDTPGGFWGREGHPNDGLAGPASVG